MVQRAATAALVALSVSGLVQQAGFAASERTTALVTIAEANARCLIQTKQMKATQAQNCLLYTSPSPRDATLSRMPSSA